MATSAALVSRRDKPPRSTNAFAFSPTGGQPSTAIPPARTSVAMPGTVTSNTTLHGSYLSGLILRRVETRRSLLLSEGRPEAYSGQQPHHPRDARAALADRAAPEHRNPLAPGPPSPRQRCTSAPARANQPRHRT